MDFNFRKIEHLTTMDDRIFQLFLKHGIKDDTSLQFVKDYLSQTAGIRNNNSSGTSASKIFAPDIIPLVLKKLDEKEHYVIKKEEVIDMNKVKEIFLRHKENNRADIEYVNKLEKKERTIIYINPYGIVRLMEDDCKVYRNDNLQALFYKILLFCVYEKDEELSSKN